MQDFLCQHGVSRESADSLVRGGCITMADLEYIDEQVLDEVRIFKPMERRKLLLLKSAQVPASAKLQELADLLIAHKILRENAVKYAVALSKEGFDSPEKLGSVTKLDLNFCGITSLMDVRIILALQTTSDHVSKSGRRLSITKRKSITSPVLVEVKEPEAQRAGMGVEEEERQKRRELAEQARLDAEHLALEEEQRVIREAEAAAAALLLEQKRKAAIQLEQERQQQEAAAAAATAQRLEQERQQQEAAAAVALRLEQEQAAAAAALQLEREQAATAALQLEQKLAAFQLEQEQAATAAAAAFQLEQAAAAAFQLEQAAAAAFQLEQEQAAAAALRLEQEQATAAAALKLEQEQAAAAALQLEQEQAAAAALQLEQERAAAALQLQAALQLEQERVAAAQLQLEKERAATQLHFAQELERQRAPVASAATAPPPQPFFELGKRADSVGSEDSFIMLSTGEKSQLAEVQEGWRWEKRNSNLEEMTPKKHNSKDWRSAALAMRERVNNLKLVSVAGYGPGNASPASSASSASATGVSDGSGTELQKTPCERFQLNLIAPQNVICTCGFPKVMHNDFLPKKKTLKEFQPHDFDTFGRHA